MLHRNMANGPNILRCNIDINPTDSKLSIG